MVSAHIPKEFLDFLVFFRRTPFFELKMHTLLLELLNYFSFFLFLRAVSAILKVESLGPWASD